MASVALEVKVGLRALVTAGSRVVAEVVIAEL